MRFDGNNVLETIVLLIWVHVQYPIGYWARYAIDWDRTRSDCFANRRFTTTMSRWQSRIRLGKSFPTRCHTSIECEMPASSSTGRRSESESPGVRDDGL
jgi:hypothetical protein